MIRTALVLTLLASSALAEDNFTPAPIPAAEATSKFTMPEGFSATLFAGEPDIVQPMSFTFDDRGRMWVVECLSYPKWTTDGTGNDRITILEDTDNDGKHDKKIIFYDKGANVSSVEYGFGGIWITSIPNLLFIPDHNHDDIPDGPPEVILDGWDLKARHNVVNSLAWGPDGWLYGCNGILSNASIGIPGSPDAERVRMNCGVWRYHPTRKIVEAFAHGTTNPWGLDWDEYGQMMVTNCVIKHLFHFAPGGHYDRMFGQDVNPHAYQLMPSIADHLHWAGGHWTISRGGQGLHSDAGGGHAHAGCMVYLGDNWPQEYRNNVFTCNIHGNRLNRDTLELEGSSYVAKHAPDFLFANDPWFRGLTIKYGPDGGVYVSDWTDTGECHNYEVADTTNGRIYKVVYGEPKTVEPFDLAKQTDVELASLQFHDNEWFVRRARTQLQERAVTREIDPEAQKMLVLATALPGQPAKSLRALWALNAIGKFDYGFIPEDMGVEDFEAGSWIVQLGVDLAPEDTKASRLFFEKLADAAGRTDDPRLLLSLAAGAQKLAVTGRDKAALPIVHNLVKRELPHDHYLPSMVWLAVESLVETHRDVMAAMLPDSASPFVRESLARRLISTDGGLDLVLRIIADGEPAEWQADTVRGIVLALGGAARMEMPMNWPAAAKKLGALKDPAARRNVQTVALVFGDATARADLLKQAANLQAVAASRVDAIELLVTDRAEALPPLLIKLLDDEPIRTAAIRGLAAFDQKGTAEALLKRYAKLTPAEKEDVIQTLSARPEWAVTLLDAVKANKVPRQDVSSLVVRQLLTLKKDDIKEKVTGIWGEIKPASQQKVELAQKYRHQLTEDVIAKADLKTGQALFAKTCGNCHKLYGTGGAIGPELTGSQRTNLDYLLDNVLDPSAIVAREYAVTVLELESGRVIQGFVVEETALSLTIQTANERIAVPKDQIEARTSSNVSMMPEGLLDRLSEVEMRDLVAYLKTREPLQ